MSEFKWSLLHDLGYLYFVLGSMGQNEEKAKEVRIKLIIEKFSELQFEGANHDKILREAMQTLAIDSKNSMDPVIARYGSSLNNITSNLSKKNLSTFINDLLFIVNAASPQDDEINQINSLAKQLGIKNEKSKTSSKKEKKDGSRAKKITLNDDNNLMSKKRLALSIFKSDQNEYEKPDREKSSPKKAPIIDSAYDEALELVTDLGQASISLIQKYMKIGYNQAAQIIERMEDEGVVGPSKGIKPRKVLARNLWRLDQNGHDKASPEKSCSKNNPIICDGSETNKKTGTKSTFSSLIAIFLGFTILLLLRMCVFK